MSTSPNSQLRPSPSKLPPATSPNSFAHILHCDLTTAKRLLFGPLIEISVGPEQKKWHIHHNLLSHHSPYFRENEFLNGEEKHLKDGKVELRDEDPTAFRILVKWLYQGRIEDVASLKKEQKWEYAYACQNLYMLCEKLGIRELKNQAIDQFRRGCYEYVLRICNLVVLAN